tara:strand:+ start:13914 stop:14168 length:255 start_codon:yes stop_codon:yes gene_type:complete
LSKAKSQKDGGQMPSAETDGASIAVDDKEYKVEDMTDDAKAQLLNIQFVDGQIQQLKNEWAISDTARLGYTAALKGELVKIDNN